MTPRITLPGDIPGLLRRGSPVLVPASARIPPGPHEYALVDGEDIDSDGWWVWTSGRGRALVAPAHIWLDLTDATGRAHAAWWLASHAKNWPHTQADAAAWCRLGDAWAIGPVHYWPMSHVAFAGINPLDPRLLPDGSRWVDAEALRLVCLHIAGASS